MAHLTTMDHGRREMKRRSITIAVIVTLIVLPCGFLVGLTVTLYELRRASRQTHAFRNIQAMVREYDGRMLEYEKRHSIGIVIERPDFGDDDLALLAQYMEQLGVAIELDLHGTSITDHGLQSLHSVNNLVLLNAVASGVTEQGAKELVKNVPFCLIWYGEGELCSQ